MVRTQIYLTQAERDALDRIAGQTGRTHSALIREAIDRYVAAAAPVDRRALLESARGLWRDARGLPDFRRLRREWDRERAR